MLLQVQHFQTLYYDDHFHAFVIFATSDTSIINVEQLPTNDVIHSHTLFNGSNDIYITLKHAY